MLSNIGDVRTPGTTQPFPYLQHHFRHARRKRRARHEPGLAVANGVSRAAQQPQHLPPAAGHLSWQAGKRPRCRALCHRLLRLRLRLHDTCRRRLLLLLHRRAGRLRRGSVLRRGCDGGWRCGGRLAAQGAVECPSKVGCALAAMQESILWVGALPLSHHLHKAHACRQEKKAVKRRVRKTEERGAGIRHFAAATLHIAIAAATNARAGHSLEGHSLHPIS